MDVRVSAEAPQNPTHVEIRREDYRPPDWLVPEIALKFTLGIEKTRVQAKLSVERTTMAILPWLVPLFVALILITFIPAITLWLPTEMGLIR